MIKMFKSVTVSNPGPNGFAGDAANTELYCPLANLVGPCGVMVASLPIGIGTRVLNFDHHLICVIISVLTNNS